jgi:hypothetical protein
MVVKATHGSSASKSIVKLALLLAVLPARSVAVTVSVWSPSAEIVEHGANALPSSMALTEASDASLAVNAGVIGPA